MSHILSGLRVVGWCDGAGLTSSAGAFYLNGVGQGPTALAVGAGGVVWTFFSLVYHFSFPSFSLYGRRPDID